MQETITPPKKLSGVQRAIIAAGGQAALARLVSEHSGIEIDPPHVAWWVKVDYVPTKYILAVSRATGIAVEDLLPETPKKKRSDAGHQRVPDDQH